MGVKEFRERFSEVASGSESVLITKNGRILGRYMPEHQPQTRPAELAEWTAKLERRRDLWRETTPDWRERSLAAGIPPEELEG